VRYLLGVTELVAVFILGGCVETVLVAGLLVWMIGYGGFEIIDGYVAVMRRRWQRRHHAHRD